MFKYNIISFIRVYKYVYNYAIVSSGESKEEERTYKRSSRDSLGNNFGPSRYPLKVY